MSSLLVYFGGKHYQSRVIVPEMLKHKFTCYVEPYFGAGHVLWSLMKHLRQNSRIDYIINDLSQLVYSFWKCVSDKNLYKELMQRLIETPYSRDLKRDLDQTMTLYMDIENLGNNRRALLDNAWRLYVLSRQGYGGKLDGGGWGISYNGSPNHALSKFYKPMLKIPRYHKMIHRCQITNQDAFAVIKAADGDYTMFYCDPPYFDGDKKGLDAYLNEGASFAYIKKLFDLLSECKGMSFVSHSYIQVVDDYVMAKPYWRRIDLKVTSRLGSTTGRCNLKKFHDCVYVLARDDQLVQSKQMDLFECMVDVYE